MGMTDDLECTTGKITIDGDIFVKYWKYTDPKNTSKSEFPVIAMHGGPAFTH
mgnify:CR=1 FL=1|jgi:hypothetical protein